MYVLHTSDVLEVAGTTMATFADDMTIISVPRTEKGAKYRLQYVLILVLERTRKWCIKLNSFKSTHVDFTNNSTLGILDSVQTPYTNTVKYLDMILDAKLRWNEFVKIKIMELQLK